VVAHRHNLVAARVYLGELLLRQDRASAAAPLIAATLVAAAEAAADAPNRTSLLHLARCLVAEAIAGGRTDAPDSVVEEAFAEAIRILEYLIALAPQDLRFHSYLGAAASNQAQILLMRQQDTARAIELLRRAVTAQRVAVAGAPSWRTSRAFLEQHLVLLALACFRHKDVAQGRATLDELAGVVSDASEHIVTVAAGMLYCGAQGQLDATDAALAILRRLAGSSSKSRVLALATDRRFAALHGDPRFLAILDSARETVR
jgi:tetratricopeptide (TPR) repeat protein